MERPTYLGYELVRTSKVRYYHIRKQNQNHKNINNKLLVHACQFPQPKKERKLVHH
jgi:hypothetical protein